LNAHGICKCIPAVSGGTIPQGCSREEENK